MADLAAARAKIAELRREVAGQPKRGCGCKTCQGKCLIRFHGALLGTLEALIEERIFWRDHLATDPEQECDLLQKAVELQAIRERVDAALARLLND